MPKRISRKLLVGLGSIVTFGAVGTVSGFGIKSIIDSSLNNSKLNQLTVNSSASGTLTELPNYHVAERDMFIETKNLKRFHFGNTQIGQKITPWGWLGVFDDDGGVRSRIALTAWNGEIIWVNEDYSDKEHNVYDMQYDFNSNMLFVLRTDSTNGFYENGAYPKLWLEVLNAKTGERYKDAVSDTEFNKLQQNAKQWLMTESTLLEGYDSNDNVKKKTQNLYYLDLTYSKSKNAILATWMPNYMQMARQSYKGNQEGSLPSFFDVIKTWENVATSFMFNETDLKNGQRYEKKQRNFKLLKSDGINPVNDSQNKLVNAKIEEGQLNPSPEVNADQIYLLTNPFFTTSHDDKAFVMHLIGANPNNGRVYHKTIGWEIDLSDGADQSGKIYSLTVGNENLTDRRRYDNIEYWGNGGNYFDLKQDKSWTKAKGWNPEFINANLRANKNMFDENSIVFAYPYSSSSDETSNSTGEIYGNSDKAMPVFNVTQIWLDKKNAQFKKTEQSSKKFHTNYNFGKQIDDYYVANGPNYGKDNKLNPVYPYPNIDSFDEKNVNHSYNRLISVSPFDNTIIYAAKPNIDENIFEVNNRGVRESWAGFWLANSWAWDTNINKKYYHPLVVANDQRIVSDSDRFNSSEMSYMLSNINDLYRNGFTFDISSRIDVNATGRTTLNLYFNQTGNGVNDSYNTNEGFQSSKIGLLRDVIYDAGSNKSGQPGSKGWADNITPKFPGSWENWSKKLFVTTINKDSFSSIIHSRADLKKWYPRTWSNVNFASNMLKAEEIFHIDSQQISDIPVATKFGTRLTASAFSGDNKSIDLVSAWKDINEDNSKYNKRFNRLIMKRPKIQAGLTSEPDGLGLVTKYELPKILFDSIVGKKDWEIKNNQANLTLTKVDTVQNTSKQILSAWGNAYKMKKIASTTADINQASTDWKEEITVTEVLDKKDHISNPNQITFGNDNNNNITRNGVPALRLMLRIVKPAGNNLPRWISNLSESFFSKAYPLEPAYQGETTFKDVVKAFANQKAQLINLSETNTAAVGLGNLKIDAYLELNPKFGGYTKNTEKIYSVPGGGKAIIDKNKNNQLIIYKDQFRGSRTIYDQSSIDYTDFSQGGFGISTEASWANPNELNNQKNIKVTVDYDNNLQDNLVRKQGGSGPLLTFDFKDATSDLELTPSDQSWFENHFKNYNRLLGLFVQFEYQAGSSADWIPLTHNGRAGNNLWTDEEITKNLTDNNNKLLLSNVPQDIKKLRFKLVKNPDRNDPNATIDITNFTDTDSKYISDEFNISVQRIMVDKSWISEATLSNNSSSLDDINATDITNFEQSVLAKIKNENERSQVKLVYEFESNVNLTADQLAQKIQTKFTNFNTDDQGVFALWDGNGTNGIKIKAKFALKNSGNDFKLITATSSNPTDDDLSNDVKSNIKSKINIGDYINQLKSKPISATIGNQPGTITAGTIKIPGKEGKPGFGRFNGKSFDVIKTILATQGISIKFKQQEANGAWSANWMELNEITTYATSDPKIKMGFIFDNTNKPANLQLLEGQNEITNNKEYELKLNLPKVIKLPEQADINEIIEAFKKDVFSGNTKNLEVNNTNLEAAKTKAIEKLIAASGGGSAFDPIKNNGLIFQFKLESSDWKGANDLKTWLSQQTNDIDNNSIKMKVVLSDNLNNDFMLDEQLKQKEFEILENDNKKVKKYINGTEWENALNNSGISLDAGSNKDNLSYTFNTALNDFAGNGQFINKEVTLEYQLVTANNNNNNTWQQGKLPSKVDANINAIKVRIANISTIAEVDKIYTYGPQKESRQAVLTIDLQNIPTILNIDPIWFEQTPISDTPLNDLNLLTTNVIQKWEEKIWQKVNNNQGLPPELNDKVYIKYTLEIGNTGHENLEAGTLQTALLREQKKYDSTEHHGIFGLWNSTDNTGYKIKATFAKRPGSEQKIQFKKDNQNVDNDENLRTSFVNTDNVKSTLDLSAWVQNLMNKLTVVSTDAAGTIPAGGLKPPKLDGEVNSKLFAQQEFGNIEKWLKEAKVKFWWTKDENGTRNWVEGTSAITQYDATKKKLWFALENQSNNLILKLGNGFPDLNETNRDNKTKPIEIKLDAPAIIDVHPNQINDIGKHFSGNTKYLVVKEQEITQKLTEIKKGLGSGFERAPLTIMIQVGDEQFYDYKEVASELKKINDDVASGIVTAKFAIDQSDPNKDKFQIKSGGDANQQIINDNGQIKVYINDKGIYNDLQATTASGSSKQLRLEWKNGISIDPKSGVLSTPNFTRGKGLRLEFTFNKQLTGGDSDPVGNNINEIDTKWVKEQPKSFRPGIDDKLFIRIRLVNDKYTYDKINKKIEIDLTKIKSIIEVDPAWLNQSISQTEIDINNFNETHVQTYETAVFNAMIAGGINSTLKDKIEIKYEFNGNQDLNKTQLIELIKNYKNNNLDNPDFGILQLWNKTSGIKIISKFAIKKQDESLFELEIKGGDPSANRHELDTTNVFTIIEFDKVIIWLTTTNKLVRVTGTPQNAIFEIPPVKTSGDIFNEKSWNEVTSALLSFGITTQYREILNNNQPVENDWKDLSQVTRYDANIGKIGIRFKFDKTKSKNIKLKTDNSTTYDGKTTNATPEFKVSLSVRLILNINSTFVNEFIKAPNVISGNTKYLTIDSTKEQVMINGIKNENEAVNNEFINAGLKVKYKLESQSEWKERDAFIQALANTQTDQKSNKVLFKFEVTDTTNFDVNDSAEKVLFDPASENDHDKWKVKIFINNGTWENDASNVVVSGTTSGLIWKWKNLQVSETNNKVGNDKLEVQFSAKENPNYDDNDVEENGNIKTKWTRTKPNTLDPTIRDLWIRLKAKAGYVYGPSYTGNNQTKTADVHKVDLQIKREIIVDPKALKASLTVGNDGFVDQITVTDLDKFVQEGLDRIAEVSLKEHVTVKFNFNGLLELSSQQLFEQIQNIINNNSTPNYGILQLWNGTKGTKIEAYYELKDSDGEYVLITGNNGGDPNAPQEVVTGHIRTKIDLQAIIADLQTKKIGVKSNRFKNSRALVQIQNWEMPGIKEGQEALNGLEWNVFENRLKDVGVLIESKTVTTPDTNIWKPLDELKEYDDTTLQLALRFRINQQEGENIVLSVLGDNDVEGNSNNLTSGEFKMNINAPATVVIEDAWITTFISQDSFTGNTKFLKRIEKPEKELIAAIVKKNLATNPNIFSDLESRLEVQYYLGATASSNDSDWRIAEEFIQFLEEQTTDQNTNKIWFRFNIKDPTDLNGQIFQIDKTAKVLNQEQINEQAKIKIYINETGFTEAIKQLKAVGSTDNFQIQGINDWINSIPIGLEVWWSTESSPNEEDDNNWNKIQPTALNPDKKLWVRFKVQGGYEFEGARANNPKYSEKKIIDTTGITVIIKLQKNWLEKIKMTGNFIEPNIDESEVKKLIDPNLLPPDNPNLIILEYRIKGTSEWFKKDAFIKKIKELKGSKDLQNFILKREELEVRFSIDNINDNDSQYGLEIDGEIINKDNRDQYNVQIIDDANSRNDSFLGIINVDLIKDFIKENFRVEGSTSKPRLIIKNKEIMNTLFMPYVGANLFDIQFTTNKNAKDEWDWTNNQSILKNGQFIEPDDLWQVLNTIIKPDKKFALRFISTSNKYKIYKDNQEQNDGYVLDISDNVKITIEITNPFTDKGKTLGIWTRDDNKQAKYYQGEGGFKIVVADKSSLDVNINNIQSAQDFLEKSSLAQNEKEALEFVFHNFGSSAEVSEIQRVKNAITDYDGKTWQSFDLIKDSDNNGNWSKNIGLKVGDYLAVAIRVKKEKAINEDPFVLKDNDYSMILPVMQVGSDLKKSGRISGYKIKTNEITLDKSSVTLLNMVNPDLPPLDGWTLLSGLNLNSDEKGNYLGVDLNLEFYNDFYKKTGTNEIWISGSGQKLVKRRSSGWDIEETGIYKDGSGKQITDENGQPVKIYKNKITKRLSEPIKSEKPTKTKLLNNLGNGAFRLIVDTNNLQEQGLLSLFKNQDVNLKLVASKGEGTDDLPDFYLDDPNKIIELKDIINPKIKFTVENENKISYGWNYEEFSSDQIKYKDPKDPTNKRPEEGFAQIATIFKLIKKEGNDLNNSTVITAQNAEEAVKKIQEQLDKDFDKQLKFQIEYYDSKGSSTLYEGNNIYQFQDLKNKDRIVLKIVATEDDLYYVNTERPLIINVDGLTQASPDQSTLQHLRVKQGGVIDGQGSFKVLVSDPNNTNEDDRQILKGWKFMIRVWGTDKKIKIQWTDDPGLVKGLTNGDKVEWKLVSEEGNPVTEAYYNTIALQHEQKPDGKIEYKFAQVNYKNGDGTYDVVKEGIGDYPEDENQYPEDSGFVISGLKSAVDIFQISKENFAKVMQQLNPTYVGINKQGTIKMEPKYFEDKYWVNSDGELFVKDQQATLKAQDQEQTKKEIPLTEFLDNVTFYTHDPVLANYQGGFKFSGNDVNNNNHLTNGDKVWATFDMLNESDENIIINGNEIVSSVTLQLADVSGLKEVIDPMSPLWYVLMALAGVVTLGTATLIAFLMTRHKKLKGK